MVVHGQLALGALLCGYLRAYEYEDLTEDVDDQAIRVIDIVEGCNLPQSIAGGKQHCAQRVESNQLEAPVAAGNDVSSQLSLC
jgi:hypothetical protein